MSLRKRILTGIGVHRYWLVALMPLLLPLAWSLHNLPGMSLAFAWVPTIVLFVVLPVLDWLIGPDVQTQGNPAGRWYPARVLPMTAALSFACVLAWSLWLLAQYPQSFPPIALIGWVLGLGHVGGVVAINVAHELVHRRMRWERVIGGILLSLVGYGGFKIEHTRWHHVHVATSKDPSSAPLGSTVYGQVPLAMWRNTVHAVRLARASARQKGRALPWLFNEWVGWTALTATLTALVAAWLGPLAAVVFLVQGLLAAALLGVVNFIEHYGLSRRVQEDGRYERPGPAHSWDADFWLSNSLLLALPRHADHHANPGRSFSELRLNTGAPQLPLGYESLVSVALIPPLWRRLVHPRLP